MGLGWIDEKNWLSIPFAMLVKLGESQAHVNDSLFYIVAILRVRKKKGKIDAIFLHGSFSNLQMLQFYTVQDFLSKYLKSDRKLEFNVIKIFSLAG